jgi:hypothetical protein
MQEEKKEDLINQIAEEVKAEIKEPAIAEVQKTHEQMKAEVAENEKNISYEFKRRYELLCKEFNRQVDHQTQLVITALK